jgi:arginase
MTPAGLALIGVPANSSGTVDGVAGSPAVLRQRGLSTALARDQGFTDADDLVLPVPVPVRGPSGLLAEDALVAMIGQVARAVGAARGRGWFPLLLGGDCPVILGALAGLQAERDRPGLLFIDGHEDAWPPRASRPEKQLTANSGWRCGRSIPASARSCAPCCPGSIPQMSPPSARATLASWPPRAWPAWTGSWAR